MVLERRERNTFPSGFCLKVLKMVLEPDTRQCVSKDAGPNKGDCEIPHRWEKRTEHDYKGVELAPIGVNREIPLLDEHRLSTIV